MTFITQRTVVLASGSPSRKRLLESVGIRPEIMVSGINEEDPYILRLSPKDMVLTLAIMKAHTVRAQVGDNHLIIGCDSSFEFEEENLGKPLTSDIAIARAKRLRGNMGLLHTGHCVIDTKTGIEFADISTSKVYFVDMTDSEIHSYVESGEPLSVAGGFTLDGLSAPFIDHIDGDPTGIIGLALPILRRAVMSFGLQWMDISEMAVIK